MILTIHLLRGLAYLLVVTSALAASQWPGFRGVNGPGVTNSGSFPVEFSPDLNLLWRTPLPMGKSSPVIVDERIFITGHAGDQCQVMALDHQTGRVLWRQELRKTRDESRNDLNDAAAPTPATDGENVYVFFSEIGLMSYGPDGNQRWEVPLGPFDSEHGMSSSPIFADGKIILLVDQIGNSYLAAFDPSDGSLVWKTERPSVMGGYSTPIVHHPEDGDGQVLAASPTELVGYSVKTGKRLWWVNGLGYQPKSVPVVDGNTIYVNAGGFGGRPGIPFDKIVGRVDANKDGKISFDEFGGGNRFAVALMRRWAGGDKALDAAEWEEAQKTIRGAQAFLAVRLGGQGDVTDTHVRWRVTKSLPRVRYNQKLWMRA